MSEKIHVLYTISNFDTSGSGKVVYDLAKHIDYNRFKVSIVCKHSKGEFYKEVEQLGLPIHLINFTVPLRPYYSLISRVQGFKRFLKAQKIDVVHSWHWSSDWSEVLACKLAGVPYVYTKKSMGWQSKHWRVKSWLSSYIITVNHALHKLFKNKRKVALIPFGIDTNFYKPERVTSPTDDDAPFTLITVANLVAVKNIEILIQAIHQLEHLNLQLDIVGDHRTTYAGELMHMVEDLNLGSKVHFKGKQDDVRPFLNCSDLYVICSKNEGMPMALVEAMAMAIPVLGSDIPGISFVLGSFKELRFESNNVTALKQKIEWIYHMRNEERQDLGQKLRKYCIDNFSMEQFMKRHEDIYIKLS